MEAFDASTRKERCQVEDASQEDKLEGLELGLESSSGARFCELERFAIQTQSQLDPNSKLSEGVQSNIPL